MHLVGGGSARLLGSPLLPGLRSGVSLGRQREVLQALLLRCHGTTTRTGPRTITPTITSRTMHQCSHGSIHTTECRGIQRRLSDTGRLATLR